MICSSGTDLIFAGMSFYVWTRWVLRIAINYKGWGTIRRWESGRSRSVSSDLPIRGVGCLKLYLPYLILKMHLIIYSNQGILITKSQKPKWLVEKVLRIDLWNSSMRNNSQSPCQKSFFPKKEVSFLKKIR